MRKGTISDMTRSLGILVNGLGWSKTQTRGPSETIDAENLTKIGAALQENSGGETGKTCETSNSGAFGATATACGCRRAA